MPGVRMLSRLSTRQSSYSYQAEASRSRTHRRPTCSNHCHWSYEMPDLSFAFLAQQKCICQTHKQVLLINSNSSNTEEERHTSSRQQSQSHQETTCNSPSSLRGTQHTTGFRRGEI